jgi:hypothetical protein
MTWFSEGFLKARNLIEIKGIRPIKKATIKLDQNNFFLKDKE